MKGKIILIILLGISVAEIKKLSNINYENPNGQPLLISMGIEKNINSFKYYNESSFYITAPISKLVTLKYRENVIYSEEMAILKSDHNKIQNLSKHYSIELHIPMFALFKWNLFINKNNFRF